MVKYQEKAEKNKKCIRNRMYTQIKKNKHDYFQDTNGQFIEKQKGSCNGCELTDVPVRALDGTPTSDQICTSCACDFQLCLLLILMKNGKLFES